VTRQRPPELFVSERPIRSEYAQEKSYALRRFATLVVLALIIGGAVYGLWGHGAHSPADIPTIQAEGEVKQKPADPGGIDIPHQDVQVYDQLEGKNTPAQQIEHLLPPPEAPPVIAPRAATPPAAPAAPAAAVAAAPVAAPQPPPVAAEPEAPPAPVAAPAPAVSPQVDNLLQSPKTKTIATTVAPIHAAPAPDAAPTAAPAQNLTIEQIIAQTQPKETPSKASSAPVSVLPTPMAAPAAAPAAAPPVSPAPSPLAAGSVAVQLASANDSAKAQALMGEFQRTYAAQLGAAQLHVVRADLGSRGIFYRIQSQGLSEGAANQICSALKQKHAGCILVRK
jgi:hypothetical protein